MKKLKFSEQSQTLVLIIFIVVIFSATVASIASLTTRELEMEEIQERALQVSYAAETGKERAMHYLKNNTPTTQVTIKKDCSSCDNNCPSCCPDSTFCNSCNNNNNCNCDCDKNPMSKGYYYEAYLTPEGGQRPNNEQCDERFCIDVNSGID